METTTDSTVATTGWINNDKTLKVDDLFWPVIWFSRLAFFGDFDWPPFWIWWTKSATRARTGRCQIYELLECREFYSKKKNFEFNLKNFQREERSGATKGGTICLPAFHPFGLLLLLPTFFSRSDDYFRCVVSAWCIHLSPAAGIFRLCCLFLLKKNKKIWGEIRKKEEPTVDSSRFNSRNGNQRFLESNDF